MTDARFPERWLADRRLLRLTADDFRLYAMALMWSVANRTDGVIYDDDLALIPGGDNRGSPARLAKSGLWLRVKDYWLMTEFEGTQTSRSELEVLDNMRRAQRDKKRRQRAQAATARSDVPGYKRGDMTRQRQRQRQRTGTDSEQVDNWGPLHRCLVCKAPLSEELVAAGERWHPGCDDH